MSSRFPFPVSTGWFAVAWSDELAPPGPGTVERHEFRIATCLQEIAENGHDPAHFSAVHGVPAVPTSRSEFEGPRLHAENRGELATPRGGYPGEPGVSPAQTSVEARR